MKVLNLQCALGHGFEGWFGSQDDFEAQQADGRLSCPMCGSTEVRRLPSAPRLNLSGARAAGDVPASPSASSAAAAAGATVSVPGDSPAARVAAAMRSLLAQTEDVGTRFAEEARRMHYGEAPAKAIRGIATPEQRDALADEGIETLSLRLPPTGPLQ